VPADPLYKYFEKGEIKARYWNPCGLFDEVHIISLTPRDIDPQKVQTLVGDAKLHIHSIGKPSMWSLALYYTRIRSLVAGIKPDLIRAHGPWHTGSLAVYAGRKLQIPVLVSVHSDRDAQRRHEPSLLLQMVRPLERYTLSNASVVICVSDYLHDYARRHGARRTYTIYNKVYCDAFAARDFGQRKGPLKILSVMRLDRAKYPECLIDAIAPLNAHLKLIGKGEMAGALRDQVARLGLQGRVEFIDQVPNSEISAHYKEADIFAMATHYEGFCIPVLEAMAASLPVVASATGPIPEVLAGTGLVVDKNPAEFTEALAALAADPDRCERLGQAARCRALAVDGMLMEEREANLYQVVMGRRQDELAALLSDAHRFVN
jgi:glycosyltransferase involved in cell wall biosynthesis